MYVDMSGLITAWSSHCPTAFGRTVEDVSAGILRINDLIPGCFDLRAGEFVQDHFTFLRCSGRGRHWICKAEVVKLAVVEVTVYVLQIALRHEIASEDDVVTDFVAESCRRAGMAEAGKAVGGEQVGGDAPERPHAQAGAPPTRPPLLEMTSLGRSQSGAGAGAGAGAGLGVGAAKAGADLLSPSSDGKAGAGQSPPHSGSATPLLMDASPAPPGSGSAVRGRSIVARRRVLGSASEEVEAGARTPDSAVARDADEAGDADDDLGQSTPLQSVGAGAGQRAQPTVYHEAAEIGRAHV